VFTARFRLFIDVPVAIRMVLLITVSPGHLAFL